MGQIEKRQSNMPAPARGSHLARGLVESMGSIMDDLLRANGKRERGEFIADVALTLQKTPQLNECTQASLKIALCRAAASGLKLGGESWLVPRRNKGKWEASFQVGYKGEVAMAWKSGQVKDIGAGYLHEHDVITEDDPVRGVFKFRPGRGPDGRGSVVGFWAHVETVNGGSRTYFCDAEEARAYADKYGTGQSEFSAWGQFEKEMILRRPIREVLKLIPKAKQQQQAHEAEHASLDQLFASVQRQPAAFGLSEGVEVVDDTAANDDME